MAIHPSDHCLPAKDKTTYYIFIYNKPSPPRDPKPFQILKADTWDEAKRFAVCFVSATNLQYVEISALSPKIQEYFAFETAKSEFWNEEGTVMYTERKMPAPVVKMYTERMSCPRLEK